MQFLGLFWMTAPLAWLYAIPYERFLSANSALDMNLCTLGLVALWRVVLMIRVLHVCTGQHILGVIGVVGMFSSGLVFLAVGILEASLVGFMGGVHSPQEPTVVQSVTGGLFYLSLLTGGISLFLAGKWMRMRWVLWKVATAVRPPFPSYGLVALAASSLLGWVFILPFTQPEQQRRYRVERAIRTWQADVALAELSAHPREAFPPHWEPPPTMFQRWSHREPMLVVHVLEESTRMPTPEWVRKLYMDRLRLLLDRHQPDNEWYVRVAELLPRLPGGLEILNQPLPEEWELQQKRENLQQLRHIRELLKQQGR